jgi:hypothetical protein
VNLTEQDKTELLEAIKDALFAPGSETQSIKVEIVRRFSIGEAPAASMWTLAYPPR